MGEAVPGVVGALAEVELVEEIGGEEFRGFVHEDGGEVEAVREGLVERYAVVGGVEAGVVVADALEAEGDAGDRVAAGVRVGFGVEALNAPLEILQARGGVVGERALECLVEDLFGEFCAVEGLGEAPDERADERLLREVRGNLEEVEWRGGGDDEIL